MVYHLATLLSWGQLISLGLNWLICKMWTTNSIYFTKVLQGLDNTYIISLLQAHSKHSASSYRWCLKFSWINQVSNSIVTRNIYVKPAVTKIFSDLIFILISVKYITILFYRWRLSTFIEPTAIKLQSWKFEKKYFDSQVSIFLRVFHYSGPCPQVDYSGRCNAIWRYSPNQRTCQCLAAYAGLWRPVLSLSSPG